MVARTSADLQGRTIEDFGNQWMRIRRQLRLLWLSRAVQRRLRPPCSLRRTSRVGALPTSAAVRAHRSDADAGGARHVTAIEPSEAFVVLEANTRQYGDRVRCVKARGDEIPQRTSTSSSAMESLHTFRSLARWWRRSTGASGRAVEMAGWLYGREGKQA